MRTTYSYLSPTTVSAEEMNAGLQFSLKLAAESSKNLTIFVNAIAHCDQFLKEIFESPQLNRLKANQRIELKGVSVELESINTIEAYKNYNTVLAIHASSRLLDEIDKNKSIHTLILIAEERDISREWLAAVDAKALVGGK